MQLSIKRHRANESFKILRRFMLCCTPVSVMCPAYNNRTLPHCYLYIIKREWNSNKTKLLISMVTWHRLTTGPNVFEYYYINLEVSNYTCKRSSSLVYSNTFVLSLSCLFYFFLFIKNVNLFNWQEMDQCFQTFVFFFQ